jgi:glycosyltransferase involved in cell wall biosynthesis
MLSIIISTLNEEKYLPLLLECLKLQNYQDMEIIVSDGNSEDNTVKIAQKYGCRVIVSTKRNLAHQRNEGANIAKGDIFLFLDADTLLPGNFLHTVIPEFKQRQLDVGGFYFTLHSNKPLYRIASLYGYIVTFIISGVHPVSIGGAILAKRDLHQRIHGFNESLYVGEDHCYSRDIKKARGKYGLIRSKKILFSVRRFEKEGPWHLCLKWHYMALYYIFHGDIKRRIVQYEYGNY